MEVRRERYGVGKGRIVEMRRKEGRCEEGGRHRLEEGKDEERKGKSGER